MKDKLFYIGIYLGLMLVIIVSLDTAYEMGRFSAKMECITHE